MANRQKIETAVRGLFDKKNTDMTDEQVVDAVMLIVDMFIETNELLELIAAGVNAGGYEGLTERRHERSKGSK